MVEYTSLLNNYNMYAPEFEEAALRVLRSGWYILGPELESFEKSFANYLGVKHCIGLNSGTDALILAVRALGIGSIFCDSNFEVLSDFKSDGDAGIIENKKKGKVEEEGIDEVIVPAGTYIASVLGVTENGAKPVYVDLNPDTLLINPDLIEAAITENTKAILPVHMYGQSCNMDKINSIAAKHRLAIIEDCAQCHGSTWNGKLTGTQSTLACFSFYPTKPLGALGDAGAIVTNDDDLADKVKLLRNYGSKVKYYNKTIGRNSRLDEIQAAFLGVGLKHLDENNRIRVNIAEEYLNKIKNNRIKLPYCDQHATHVYHLFPILVEDRNEFQVYLENCGIKTQVHYPIPPYVAECYKSQGHTWDEFPNASYIAQHEVSLPIYSGMKRDDVEAVIKAVNDY